MTLAYPLSAGPAPVCWLLTAMSTRRVHVGCHGPAAYIAELMVPIYTQGETASTREVRALACAHWSSRMRTSAHLDSDTREHASHVSFCESK